MSGATSFAAVDRLLREATPETTPAAQLNIRWRGEMVFANCYGWIDPEAGTLPTQPDTLFDLASVSKLFVVTTFMALVEARMVEVDQPVSSVLHQFNGLRPIEPYENPLQPGAFVQVAESGRFVDVGAITFRHLLTHTSGLPAWRPLFRQNSAEAGRRMALLTACAYPTGERVVYSDIGLILIGIAIEQLTNQPLDVAVRERLTGPLGLERARYFRVRGSGVGDRDGGQGDGEAGRFRPLDFGLSETTDNKQPNIAPTEFCSWRERRIIGEVHDENAAGLGGVAGHAGLFSTADEVARFGQMFLDGGAPVLQPATVAEMTRLQAQEGGVRRGLGFALWSPDPEASSNPLSEQAFGHLGFTGTSLWIDPVRDLVVVLLTNDVYYGRTSRGIGPLRVALHHAIVDALDK